MIARESYGAIVFALIVMTLTFGFKAGFAADSVDDARINESVRETMDAEMKNATAPRGDVPPPPGVTAAADIASSLFGLVLTGADAVARWTYLNQDWFTPYWANSVLAYLGGGYASIWLHRTYVIIQRVRR